MDETSAKGAADNSAMKTWAKGGVAVGSDPIGTIAHTLYAQLNWSQYKLLISMGNSKDTKIRGLGRVVLLRKLRRMKRNSWSW